MRWLVRPVDPDAIANLSRELGFSPLLARLLVRRGIRDPETAQRFLRPSLDQIPDPFLMADMPAAVRKGSGIWSREGRRRSEEHTSELQSRPHLVCRLLLEKKKKKKRNI